MSKIFITGATGQVGTSLIRSLVKDRHIVHAFVLPNTWHPYLNGLKNVKIFYGDVLDYRSIVNGMKGCNYAYHLAGIISYYKLDHKKMHKLHVDGTRNVFKAAMQLGIKKIVHTASTAGIGIPADKNKPLNEHSPFLKVFTKVGYMQTKRIGIYLAKEFARKGLNISIVSPTTIYGQGDITLHIGKLIKKIKKGVKKAPPGGNAVVSVDDIIDAHKLVMAKGRKGENYIFANEFLTYLEMYNIIAEEVGAKKVRKVNSRTWLPWLKFYYDLRENILFLFNKKPKKARASLNSAYFFRYFDSSKARKELGWKPKVSFRQAIRKAIQFYEI